MCAPYGLNSSALLSLTDVWVSSLQVVSSCSSFMDIPTLLSAAQHSATPTAGGLPHKSGLSLHIGKPWTPRRGAKSRVLSRTSGSRCTSTAGAATHMSRTASGSDTTPIDSLPTSTKAMEQRTEQCHCVFSKSTTDLLQYGGVPRAQGEAARSWASTHHHARPVLHD